MFDLSHSFFSKVTSIWSNSRVWSYSHAADGIPMRVLDYCFLVQASHCGLNCMMIFPCKRVASQFFFWKARNDFEGPFCLSCIFIFRNERNWMKKGSRVSEKLVSPGLPGLQVTTRLPCHFRTVSNLGTSSEAAAKTQCIRPHWQKGFH